MREFAGVPTDRLRRPFGRAAPGATPGQQPSGAQQALLGERQLLRAPEQDDDVAPLEAPVGPGAL
jgi:hypothetical protein